MKQAMKQVRQTLLIIAFAISPLYSGAQSTRYAFIFQPKSDLASQATTLVGKQTELIHINAKDHYTKEKGYGYDLIPNTSNTGKPFYFSVNIPDGDYKVTVVLGSKDQIGETSVRAESRRLFIENKKTKKRKYDTQSFLINKRSPAIKGGDYIKIKAREKGKLDWDDKLTFELNGSNPQLAALFIEPAPAHTTLFLCGNSTVVDQDTEPWASWGQMLPRFFDSQVCIANYAESGESATSFIAGNRLKKVLSEIKPGDYIFVEFGHNDEKIKGEGKGPFQSFITDLRKFVTEAKVRGAIPVLITPTERRFFNSDGTLKPTHGYYPDATRKLAEEEGVALIDLTQKSGIMYCAWGVEDSKKAFVQYPANTFPGQDKAL
ncbi:MAG: rhamnogalacturonan acetylesterase, partial [Bacteroidaceae bacterium]